MPNPTLPAPTVDDVQRIAQITDPVSRNLQITQCYYELSAALTGMFGEVANWCTFAVWASRQAGCTIRKEDLGNKIEEELAQHAELAGVIRAIAEHVVEKDPRGVREIEEDIRTFLIKEGSLQRASDAVAEGNLKVFAEIGHEFARFLAAFSDPAARTVENVQRFTSVLKPGDNIDGQQRLAEAFTAYINALNMSNARERAQAILLANTLVGYHEQRRLQEQIRAALDCADPDLELIRKRILVAIIPSWWRRIRHKIASALHIKLPLDTLLDDLVAQLGITIRRVTTQEMMELRLPDGTLKLGDDLTTPYPPALAVIDYPPLIDFIRIADPNTGRVIAGPHDWSDFGYRMHYIAHLFRSSQDDRRLLGPPFATDAVPI